jgi:hypothetical protein
MEPAAVLTIVVAAIGAAAIPCIVWLRAQKRIRHLEMSLLAQSTDGDRYEELRALIEQVAAQTEHLADGQAQLVRRLAERIDPLPLPRAEALRPVTPH